MDPLPARSGFDGLSALFEDADRALGLRITVHDLTGILHGPDGLTLLPRARTMHSHAFCQDGRRDQPGWDERCRQHCLEQVNAEVAASAAPGCHNCWKGAREVVVPIFRGGRHVLTLFAGVWRSPSPAPALLSGPVAAARNRLPRLDETRAAHIAGVLAALGEAVVSRAETLVALPDAADRAGRIRHLLRNLIAGGQVPVLQDVARLLAVSRSRAAHVVAEACGASFRDLVAAERLARAKRLLLTTGLSAHAVAAEVGFQGPHHFSRAFRAATGLPPGRWRTVQRPQG